MSEVASARLASLDAAIREVVRDLDLRLRKVLHETTAVRPAVQDGEALAALRAITTEVAEARDKAHELVVRLDMFQARPAPNTQRRASSA